MTDIRVEASTSDAGHFAPLGVEPDEARILYWFAVSDLRIARVLVNGEVQTVMRRDEADRIWVWHAGEPHGVCGGAVPETVSHGWFPTRRAE